MQQGKTETWLVTRYIDEIKRGDLIYFWMGGEPNIRGLYGWGRVVSDAPKYFKDWGFGIDIEYQIKFKTHIPYNRIKELPSFYDYILFKTAIGTNFRISDKQANDLKKIIIEYYGDEVAP